MLPATPIDQLRLPHPDQERIDAETARLLRSTARPGTFPSTLRVEPTRPARAGNPKTSPS